MFHLLIVDDEIESLEWLRELFERSINPFRFEDSVSGQTEDQISVYTANSGKKAIEILNCVKCDVVLTDIQMPGMNGISLYYHMKENWPDARVVFLTGYVMHEILYQISQEKDVRYLMKTETPDKIVDTVWETWKELQEQRKKQALLDRQTVLLDRAKYCLQRDLMKQILFQKNVEISQALFDDLEIPVNLQMPVIVFLGKIDMNEQMLSYEQQEAIIYAIKGKLPGIMKVNVCIQENCYVCGIVQPKLMTAPDWNRIIHVCAGALEEIADICAYDPGFHISFAVCKEMVELKEIGKIYFMLKEKLAMVSREKNLGVLMLEYADFQDGRMDYQNELLKLHLLEQYLEQGKYEECQQVIEEVVRPLYAIRSMHDKRALEIYYNISMIYLKHMNRNGWYEQIPFYIGTYQLTSVDDFSNWSEAVIYLLKLTDTFIQLSKKDGDYYKDQAIVKVEQYVRAHLKDDLSLQMLAEIGGFNASYLSRIFKQKYHCNLSEFILQERINRAKELLSGTDEKIYCIGEEVGYHTASSFNRVFQKSEGISPIEYRNLFR